VFSFGVVFLCCVTSFFHHFFSGLRKVSQKNSTIAILYVVVADDQKRFLVDQQARAPSASTIIDGTIMVQEHELDCLPKK
jgi:hypothetical protein